MTDSDQREIVSLREYLEHKIEASIARIEQRLDASDRELIKQAKEYERRLEQLNGEQSRIAASNAKNLPREVADQRQKEYEDWREGINKALTASAARAAALAFACSIAAGVVAALVAALVTVYFRT